MRLCDCVITNHNDLNQKLDWIILYIWFYFVLETKLWDIDVMAMLVRLHISVVMYMYIIQLLDSLIKPSNITNLGCHGYTLKESRFLSEHGFSSCLSIPFSSRETQLFMIFSGYFKLYTIYYQTRKGLLDLAEP